MLKLIIPGEEFFNEETEEFVEGQDDVEIELEHSLLSLSKWESKYQKPFLSGEQKSAEETLYYVESMILTPFFPREPLLRLTNTHLEEINAYIESPESATTFGQMPEVKGKGEKITSELIYYWMVAFTIPFECERWHLNRLFSLIRICNIKNSKPKKIPRGELVRRNAELNAQRRAMLNSTG
jgi:hypothetical protein